MAMSDHGRLPFTIDEAIEHLDPDTLSKGDVVVGTLPVGLIAKLQSRGVTFWALDLDMPREDRGESQSRLKLPLAYNARFTCYDVRPQKATQVSGDPEEAPNASQPAISLIPVSSGLVPAALAWLHKPTPQVALLQTMDMQRQGKPDVLKRWFERRSNPPTVVPPFSWDDTSYESLLEGAEQWSTTLAKERRPAVVVHLTGGNKPMSIALLRAFVKKAYAFRDGLSGPYVHTSPSGSRVPHIEDLLSSAYTVEPIRSILNVRDLFELEGFEIVSADSASAGFQKRLGRTAVFDTMMAVDAAHWRSHWYRMLDAAEKLARKDPTKEAWKTGVLNPSKASDTSLVKAKVEPRQASFQYTLSAEGRAAATRLGHALTGDGHIEFKIEGDVLNLVLKVDPSAELNFLKGKWMEYWVARHFEASNVDEWAVGLDVSRGGIRNDIDIAVACGNRLLLVEVKSGQIRGDGKDDSKGAEALYKLDSIAGALGGQFCDRWLVSLNSLTLADRNRAEAQKIQIYAGAELPSLRSAVDAWVEKNRLPRDDSFKPSGFPAPKSRATESKSSTANGRPVRK